MDNRQMFQNVYVIGYGFVVTEVLKCVSALSDKYSYNIEYIEHEVHEFNTAKTYCKDNGIISCTIEDKKLLEAKFMSIEEKSLIISASNNYLFPKSVLDKDNITVINFHNALLPKFPGRNAPSWVIYEGEEETGITWHYVTSRVDAGNIIIQKKVPIDPDVRAYELANVLMNLAYEAFAECYEDVLNETVQVVEQVVSDNRKMYLSKEVPGNGSFCVNDSWEDIYRLLRATDYAKYDIFPSVTTVIDGEEVTVLRYKIVETGKAKSGEGFLLYDINEDHVLQIKYKKQ